MGATLEQPPSYYLGNDGVEEDTQISAHDLHVVSHLDLNVLSNLHPLQGIVRERFDSDAEVVHAGDVVPSEGQTRSRGHQTSIARSMNQQGELTTDECVALSDTFHRRVLDRFHDVEVLYLKDLSQLSVGDEGGVGDSCTTVQASKDVRVVDEDVTDFFTNNHSVRLKPPDLSCMVRRARVTSAIGVELS